MSVRSVAERTSSMIRATSCGRPSCRYKLASCRYSCAASDPRSGVEAADSPGNYDERRWVAIGPRRRTLLKLGDAFSRYVTAFSRLRSCAHESASAKRRDTRSGCPAGKRSGAHERLLEQGAGLRGQCRHCHRAGRRCGLGNRLAGRRRHSVEEFPGLCSLLGGLRKLPTAAGLPVRLHRGVERIPRLPLRQQKRASTRGNARLSRMVA